MKVTETKSERTFTLELTEKELTSIALAMGCTSQFEREERAKETGATILDGSSFHKLWRTLDLLFNKN